MASGCRSDALELPQHRTSVTPCVQPASQCREQDRENTTRHVLARSLRKYHWPMASTLGIPSRRADASVPGGGPALPRPHVRGKFVFTGDAKFYVRGVSYGAFRPDASGHEFHALDVIERDFIQLAANGIHTVRIPHTMPPRPLLEAAERHGLRVMVGLSVEQHLGSLVDGKMGMPEIEALVRSKVRECAGQPALLCYALGNEIPAPMARWLGRSKIERYLKRLYQVVKEEDPDGLVTYVNYPTTEYLRLPFLDLVCFNVYLESRPRFEAYLGRLQNIAGERPLIMSELGLDGLRNGDTVQARSLDWQVRTAFAAGCAGVVVFSWTDEWYRQGHDVQDWAFGLTRADRTPKPALKAVREAFAEVPFPPSLKWPRISVVVCTYNGARTIRDCMEGLKQLAYPDYEVIVVDDGSADATAVIAREYDCRLIQTENRGLASARNTGLKAATGEIVAYTDDDAYPDPHWLTYLAAMFLSTSHAAVGGPNIAPPGDGPIAECVARAPGGPVHVLLSDCEAEHLPGCNMAFRKDRLEAIGGFDPQFRTAGDDVDVCWKLQERGWTLGFSAAAMVWHHRRNSVRAYWRQQIGYGRAEAMLERKWPTKYNGSGETVVPDGGALPAPAAGTPAWADIRLRPVAEAGYASVATTLAKDVHYLERALAGSRPETAVHRGGPQSRRRRGAVRGRLRPLGPGDRRRFTRLSSAAHGRRGSWRWHTVPPLSLVATRLASRDRAHRPLRGPGRRSRRSAGVGRGDDPRGGHSRGGALCCPRVCRRRWPHRSGCSAVEDPSRLIRVELQ